MHAQNFEGRSPKNGGQNMQNFGRFYATSDFDREYIRKDLRYPKSGSKCFQSDSSRILTIRSGELWSTNGRGLDMSVDSTTMDFLGEYISAIRGCCSFIFLHALERGEGPLKKN